MSHPNKLAPRPGPRRSLLAALSLWLPLACPGGLAAAAEAVPEVALMRTIPFDAASRASRIHQIAFDWDFIYLSAGTVIYRTQALDREAPLAPLDLGPCAYEGNRADGGSDSSRAYVHRADLYVVKTGGGIASLGTPITEHAVCVSHDQGGHFTAIDEGLKYCTDFRARGMHDYCGYLGAQDVRFHNDRIYLNAGGSTNLFGSPDLGRTWQLMAGDRVDWRRSGVGICPISFSPFEIIGRRLLQGGPACIVRRTSFDVARLSRDGMRLLGKRVEKGEFPGRPVKRPRLGHRGILFIKVTPIPKSPFVFAGVSGGLLRSADRGRSFRFVIRDKDPIDWENNDGEDAVFPLDIAYSSKRPGLMILGGVRHYRDADTAQPYLAYSTDYGRTWQDVSRLLPFYSQYYRQGAWAGGVLHVTEDPAGRLWVALHWQESEHKGADYLATFSMESKATSADQSE
jgi:hypothetical protein